MITQLNIQIEDLLEKKAQDFEVSKVFKTYIKEYISSTNSTLQESGGKDFFVKHTKQTDKIIISLYKYILRKHFGSYLPIGSSLPICVIALGSYGREQLCIYSDIDLMILYEDIQGYNLKNIMEEFITLAWDCGLKLGSRVHEINDVTLSVKEDITIKSSIIESRLIYGSKYLWYSYENVLNRIRKTKQLEYVTDKKIEHINRLKKYPLRMQCNIKDGYGGMRESNMIFWFANIIYGVHRLKDLQNSIFSEKEYYKYRVSLEFIFQIRNHLHNLANKKLDIITFDILPDLSTKLGFKNTPRHTKERQVMAKVLESLHNVHFFSSILCKKITRRIEFKKENITKLKEYRYKKNIYIFENKLFCSFNIKAKPLTYILKELISLPNDIEVFDESYINFISKTKLPAHQNNEQKKLIKTLLFKDKIHKIIDLLYKASLFQFIFPVCKKIMHQPQFDGYHELPVDLHSIQNLQYCENIKDTFVLEVFEKLDKKDKKLVKLSAFFHDIGKGRKIDHHIAGQKLFRSFGKSLNFEVNDILIVSRLIKYHNQMSRFATSEDIYSEKIILNFTGLMKNRRFLNMLYVLTYCDISAVGANIYNSSTASLLQELYKQSLPAFDNVALLTESSRKMAKQNSIKKLKAYNNLSANMKRKISYISSSQIFLQLKASDILDLAIKAKDINSYIYKIENEKALTIKIIRSQAINLGYLLGKLEYLNIASMNIFKLYDEKKCFEIKFSEKVSEADMPYIKEAIENSFDMSKKAKIITQVLKENEIIIDNNHTSFLASMKINTRDKKGLLAHISKVFDKFNIEIESAKLYTNRGRVRDLFLIEKNGNFCTNSEEIKRLLCKKL